MNNLQQSRLKEAIKDWADKIKVQKKGISWQKGVSVICCFSKKNHLLDIREYWERWKKYLKYLQENNDLKE